MAVTHNLELPIGPLEVSGPAVEAWNSRKEDNNNKKFTASELKEKYLSDKDAILSDVQNLLRHENN